MSGGVQVGLNIINEEERYKGNLKIAKSTGKDIIGSGNIFCLLTK